MSAPAGQFHALQAAIDAASNGATITVTGVCMGGAVISGRSNLTIEGVPPTPAGCPAGGLRGQELTSSLRASADEEIIKVDLSTNIVIRFLNITDGLAQGVEMKRSSNGQVACNCLARNLDGVELEGGEGHLVRDNLVTHNGDHGINVHMGVDVISQHQTLKNNCVVASGTDGIQLDWTMADVVMGNISRNNVDDGIALVGTTTTDVTGNQVPANGGCGIEVKTSNQNTFNDNVGASSNLFCCVSGTGNTGNNVTPMCR